MAKQVTFHTLGCRLNHAESSTMAQSLLEGGYKILNKSSKADVFVVNSCSVTSQAVKKCKQLVRSIRRKNPLAQIFLVGCFPQSMLEDAASISEVDYILGTNEKFDILNYLNNKDNPRLNDGHKPLVDVGRITGKSFALKNPSLGIRHTRANLKIQDGCDFFCAFCLIPFARGKSRSRELNNLLTEAKELVATGHKELVITGVNIGLYKYEGVNFNKLLDLLAKIKGLVRLRISSIEPTTIGMGFLERMADPSSKIVPHLHLPLQAASDKVLGLMRRRYDLKEYAKFLTQAKSIVKDICIGTDIITGFPGEDKESFEKGYNFLAESDINYFHVFPYSSRVGTVATKMDGKIDLNQIRQRSKKLRELSLVKWSDYCKKHLKTVREVVFEEEITKNLWQGYTDNYIRVVSKGDNLKNRLLKVNLGSIEKTSSVLFGKVV